MFDLCKNDQRTKLRNIAKENYVDKLSLNKSLVKSNRIYANPAEIAWRYELLIELLLIRSTQNVLDGVNYDEIPEIIDDICKNFIVFDYILILYLYIIYLNPRCFYTVPL